MKISTLFAACCASFAAAPAPLPAQADRHAFVGGTVYDGTGGPPIADGVVIVANGRITAVGPQGTPLPDGIDVIDCRGRFVTPGLVDAHVHYSQTGWADGRPDAQDRRATHPYEQAMADNEARPERYHRAFVACGVTAVFDVGGYPWTRRLEAQTEHDPLAPHVAATGALLTTWVPEILQLPDQKQFVLMADEATARAAVRSHAAFGSRAIKIWYIVNRDLPVEASAPLVMAVGDEARKLGLPLVVHATQLEAARVAVQAGAHMLVHSVEDRPVDDAFVQAVVQQGTYYCPTLIVRHGYVQLRGGYLDAETASALDKVHPDVRQKVELVTAAHDGEGGAARRTERAGATRVGLVLLQNLRTLHEAGARIAMGTDAGNPLTLHGPSVYPEMEAMQAAGMPAAAVLRASTERGAQAMGRGADLGVLASGRVADLLVIAKDPGADIANLRALELVCRAGVVHTPAELRTW